MEYFAGLDISMEETRMCVIDREGVVVHEQRTASTPEAIAAPLAKAPGCRRIVFETGQITPMLYHGLAPFGLPGHTPGHSGYHLSSGKDELLIWGDITHVPVVQIAHPDVGLAFDVDVEQGRATRRSHSRPDRRRRASHRRNASGVPGLRPCGARRLGLRICARFVDADI